MLDAEGFENDVRMMEEDANIYADIKQKEFDFSEKLDFGNQNHRNIHIKQASS